MKESFLAVMEEQLQKYNVSVTENGATGFRTTGNALLDLNFSVATLRYASETEIAERFKKAFFEDKLMALKWLFFARDVRGGLGERRLFRVAFSEMAESMPEYVMPLVDLIPFYGRYDDMWPLLGTTLKGRVMGIVKAQMAQDLESQSASILAKWLPSINSSSKETKRIAKIVRRALGMTDAEYRKTLSSLRRKIDVIECKMSSKRWGEIDYEAVPSNANMIYRKAFVRNDEERRKIFLEALSAGEAKINASVLFPPQIVQGYCDGNTLKAEDPAIEALWKALPDTVGGENNSIVVADGSGSMLGMIGKTNVSALNVANSIAIYFAERASGLFKNKFITFSERPQFVDLSKGKSLREKIQIAMLHSEVANTNIEAVFELILSTAIRGQMTQSDLPKNIIIISDMEFDACVTLTLNTRPDSRLFDVVKDKYKRHNYKLPRLVFWNVNSRTGTIPVIENSLGVALVSGFSTNIIRMILNGSKLDPYEALVESLNVERYAPIEEALKEAGVC